MDHAGATVGPLVAAGLMAGFALRAEAVILWSAVPGLLAVLVAAIALRQVPNESAPRTAGAAPAAGGGGGPRGPLGRELSRRLAQRSSRRDAHDGDRVAAPRGGRGRTDGGLEPVG